MVCTRAVKWGQRALACDNCDKWCHLNCMVMTSAEYNHLANSSTSWICSSCNSPNYTKIFDSITAVSNSFESLSLELTSDSLHTNSLTVGSPSSSLGSPKATSSPRKPRQNPAKPKISSLRTVVVNFQSIKNKVQETQLLIESADPDIIIGTETWLNPNIFSSEVLPSNYTVFRRDRADSHGGVLIAVKDDLVCTPVSTNKELELICVKVRINRSKSIIISAFYRPPSESNTEHAQAVLDELTRLRQDNSKCEFWVGGDFNLPDIDWPTLAVTSNQYPAVMSNIYIGLPAQCGVKQLVEAPTRGNNILDLFFTSNPSLVSKCKPIPGVGDHDAVLVDTLAKPQRSKPVRRKIYLWDKADLPNLKQEARNITTTLHTIQHQGIDALWESFRDQLLTILENNVPHKTTRSRATNPWMNTKTRRLARQKNRAFIKASTTKNTKDRTRYKKLKSACQRSIREAHDTYVHDIIGQSAKDNPKRFWSYIKGKKQESSGVSPLRNADGIIHSEADVKANILNKQFVSVFTKEDTANIPDKGPSPYSSMNNITVRTKGVEKLLSNLQPDKATGPDMIPARLLKQLSTEIAPALALVFQSSLDCGRVPRDWTMAHVVPLFKKGDKSAASNYRPVSLTSICSKALEHVLHSNIMDPLEEHNILTDAQHGFRCKRSCETQLIATIQELARGLSEGRQLDVILLDFAKAFDKVPHQRLLYKLNYYGVRGQTLSWIESFLYNRKQHVLVEGAKSDEAQVTSGVPQGTVLGPLLFLAFINDLPSVVDSQAKLFADDCLLFRPIDSLHDSNKLQEDLTALEKWESD